MPRILSMMMALLLSGQMLVPAVARAQESIRNEISNSRVRFDLPPDFARATAQKPSRPGRSSPGGRLLRNALVGAAIGGTLVGLLGSAGDCGNCGGEQFKAVLSGTMYGALIGAAIRIHPSRRPSPDRPPRVLPQATTDTEGRRLRFLHVK